MPNQIEITTSDSGSDLDDQPSIGSIKRALKKLNQGQRLQTVRTNYVRGESVLKGQQRKPGTSNSSKYRAKNKIKSSAENLAKLFGIQFIGALHTPNQKADTLSFYFEGVYAKALEKTTLGKRIKNLIMKASEIFQDVENRIRANEVPEDCEGLDEASKVEKLVKLCVKQEYEEIQVNEELEKVSKIPQSTDTSYVPQIDEAAEQSSSNFTLAYYENSFELEPGQTAMGLSTPTGGTLATIEVHAIPVNYTLGTVTARVPTDVSAQISAGTSATALINAVPIAAIYNAAIGTDNVLATDVLANAPANAPANPPATGVPASAPAKYFPANASATYAPANITTSDALANVPAIDPPANILTNDAPANVLATSHNIVAATTNSTISDALDASENSIDVDFSDVNRIEKADATSTNQGMPASNAITTAIDATSAAASHDSHSSVATSTVATPRGSRLRRATMKTSGLDRSLRQVGQKGSKESLCTLKKCKVKKDDFVQCEGCECWFHLTCAKIKNLKTASKISFYCNSCRTPKRNSAKKMKMS